MLWCRGVNRRIANEMDEYSRCDTVRLFISQITDLTSFTIAVLNNQSKSDYKKSKNGLIRGELRESSSAYFYSAIWASDCDISPGNKQKNKQNVLLIQNSGGSMAIPSLLISKPCLELSWARENLEEHRSVSYAVSFFVLLLFCSHCIDLMHLSAWG